MELIPLFSKSFIQALGWTLVHSLWQGAALAAVMALLFQMLRRRKAAIRYGLGIGALLAQLMVSGATFVLYNESVIATVSVHRPSLSAPSLVRMVGFAENGSLAGGWTGALTGWLTDHLTLIAGGWLLGAGLLFIRLLGGWLLVQRLTRQGLTSAPQAWQQHTQDLARKLGVSLSVRLVESVHIRVPMTIGWIKPVVLLPIGLLAGLSPRQVEAVLVHELAHIRRFDYLVNLFQSVVDVLFFYHPALWWLSARIREDREHCCDDRAIQFCGERTSLARALVYIEERRQARDLDTALSAPSLAMAFGARRATLLHRVKRVLGVMEDRSALPTNGLVVISGLLLGACLLVGQQVQSRANPLASVHYKNFTFKKSWSGGPLVADKQGYKAIVERRSYPHSADTLNQGQKEQLEQQIQRSEEQMQQLDRRMEELNKPMESINAQMEQYNQAMEAARQKFEKMVEAQEPYREALREQQEKMLQLNQPLRQKDEKAFQRAQAKLAEAQQKFEQLNDREMQRINEEMEKMQERWSEKMESINDSLQTLFSQNLEVAQEHYRQAQELQHLHQKLMKLNGSVAPPLPPLLPAPPANHLPKVPKAPKLPRAPHQPGKPKVAPLPPVDPVDKANN